ncbi:MAG: arylsulfatase [Lentisphaeraceae bacterium]|nr:arylsulfatase [Lentisphaeraceae bacterium]
MKSLLPLLLSLFAASCTSTTADNQKPNIIYILADDLGYGDLSCLNENSKIKTPQLDKFAAEGMYFTDAHSNSSVCTPTRYGVLTGRYAWRSRLKKSVLGGASNHLINPNRTSVADILKSQGYETAMIGKWHLGWDFQFKKGAASNGIGFNASKQDIDYTKKIINGPDSIGFDYYYGHCGSLDMAPYVYVENGNVTSAPNRITENKTYKGFWRKGPTGADFEHEQVLPNFIQRTCKYIEEKAKNDKPFFIYLPLPAPHTPILPTSKFKGKSGTNEYGDFVQQVDAHVGEIIAQLKASGIDDNTMIVFTSDNGCSPRAGFEELAAVGHNPNHIYRGHKADIYEGGHRVPFIVRWPAKVKAGTVSDATTCLTDLSATVADITGAEVSDNTAEDSVSILPALFQAKEQVRKDIIHHSIEGAFAIREGKWKLIMTPGSGGWSAPKTKSAYKQKLPAIQLYDLVNDPAESKNVYKENKDVVKSLYTKLKSQVELGRSTPGAPQSNEGKTTFEPKGFDRIKEELGL